MKVVVLSSHTQSLFWFRLDMMKAFLKEGHTVVAIGSEPENEWKEKFLNEGIEYRQIFVQRNGVNPLNDIKTLKAIKHLFEEIKPDKVFAYQAKSIIYGSLAAKSLNIHDFYALIAGLGSVFRGKGFKNSLVKFIMKQQYKIASANSRLVFFQNNDDRNEFIENGLVEKHKTKIINGSGVNLNVFRPEPQPSSPAFLFIGRLIKDKGVMEYLEACKEIKRKYPYVQCLLVGPFDSNPSAVKNEELLSYINDGVIEYFGEQKDVRESIKKCSTFVLPSYHEGTPKTILEAMAMGRSIITTDAPGCRETVIDGINGLLVKVADKGSLVNAMEKIIHNYSISKDMGEESLIIVQEKYDVNLVNKSIIKYMGL